MELIVISESKLKIMLTAPDMAHYDLESARMDCADAHTRAAFRHIFDDARDRIGFDTEGERLFIQFYASKEGGCEIFVTKLGDGASSFPAPDADPDTDEDPPVLAVAAGEMTEGERALLKRVYNCEEEVDGMTEASYGDKRLPTPGSREAVLQFNRTEDLLAVCHRLLREGYRGRSTVYIAESGHMTDWYLFLSVPDVTLYRLPRRFAFLTEYGREVNPEGLPLYLSEYGRCIREGDAAEVLGRLYGRM